ncbi:MAG: DUF2971 domain-containing protein [Methanosarcina sp.]
MIKMAVNKFLYKYQCFEKVKDESGKDRQYTIENLANNQLYFQHPREYNDPYDSMLRYYKESTVEASINKLMKKHGFSRDKAIDIIDKNIKKGLTKRDGDVLRTECYGRDHLPLPLVCCFSKNSNNILMWSHYAHHHKGVCLRFKSKLKEGFPHLTINSKDVRLFPMNYDIIPPDPINFHNQNEENIQLSKLLSTKSLDWKYEQEYRMFLTEEDAKGNLNKFKKDELEGIILGMRTNYIDANEIYKTINENYLKKGINVNFYVAEFIPGEYKAPPKKIDIKEHLNKLFEEMKLEDEIKNKQRLNSDFSILHVDSQEPYFLQIRKGEEKRKE